MGATEDEITEVLLAIAPVIGLGRMVGAVAASRARSGTTSRRAGGPRWSVTVPQARRASAAGSPIPRSAARNARHEQQAYPISDYQTTYGHEDRIQVLAGADLGNGDGRGWQASP